MSWSTSHVLLTVELRLTLARFQLGGEHTNLWTNVDRGLRCDLRMRPVRVTGTQGRAQATTRGPIDLPGAIGLQQISVTVFKPDRRDAQGQPGHRKYHALTYRTGHKEWAECGRS